MKEIFNQDNKLIFVRMFIVILILIFICTVAMVIIKTDNNDYSIGNKSDVFGGYVYTKTSNEEKCVSLYELILNEDFSFNMNVSMCESKNYSGTFSLSDNKIILNATNIYINGEFSDEEEVIFLIKEEDRLINASDEEVIFTKIKENNEK